MKRKEFDLEKSMDHFKDLMKKYDFRIVTVVQPPRPEGFVFVDRLNVDQSLDIVMVDHLSLIK